VFDLPHGLTPGRTTLDLNERFLDLALGGAAWVLWLLVGMSVMSVAIMIERALHYRSVALRERSLSLAQGKMLSALATKLDTPGARMFERLLRDGGGGGGGGEALGLCVESTRAVEKVRLERNLGLLGTIAANAPFVGLLGTVLEILRVFHLLGEQGVGSAQDAASIMTGISEALVATGVGLMVAIPATAAYNAFVRRVAGLLSVAQQTATRALAFAGREAI